jgi:hypothetical protein
MSEDADNKDEDKVKLDFTPVAVDDNRLLKLVEMGLMDASGDWIAGTSLSAEREKATLEYGMLPQGHLQPQGVSQIVSSDTVEAVEGYTSILSELLFNNNKLAKFKPCGKQPKDYHDVKVSSDLVNYIIFRQNPGWQLLNTWLKSGLMYKNSIIRWDYVHDHEYGFEEYDEIDQNALDLKLSDPNYEVVGELTYEPQMREIDGEQVYINIYKEVRLRVKKTKNRVKIETVPTENFRVSRDATSIDNATFIGISTEMTRSEVRQRWPDKCEGLDWGNMARLRPGIINSEKSTRKVLASVEAHVLGRGDSVQTETNTPVEVLECWIRVDRDGDGISELKKLIYVGKNLISEEDCEFAQIACFVPFEIPYEFIGLSAADMVRPTTLASTAIMRGFIENVYMTNYSPKLADPNVVDFSALQNMKPKQLIPTNGNPNGAVAPLTPDTISQGTVPLMEFLQTHKEQATGLSKAAQGLNDVLYVSGNSEGKVSMVQSAAQVRIQYMARRLVETGIRRLVEGVYHCFRNHIIGEDEIEYEDSKGYLQTVRVEDLPNRMVMDIDADVGDMGNTGVLRKMEVLGKQIIPALQDSGAGAAIKPEAALKIAVQTMQALDLDPLEFMEDYTDPAFIEKVAQSRKNEEEAARKAKELEETIKLLDQEQRKATIALTNIQSKNAMQDNIRQLVVAMDKHYQDWAELQIKAAKEGVVLDTAKMGVPKIEQMWMLASAIIKQDQGEPLANPEIKADPNAVPAALPAASNGAPPQ